MKIETGNLKLGRHAPYESLSWESKQIVNSWAKVIRHNLNYLSSSYAAKMIMVDLSSHFGLKFDVNSPEWIELLVLKWREKTNDFELKAQMIALRIYKQMTI